MENKTVHLMIANLLSFSLSLSLFFKKTFFCPLHPEDSHRVLLEHLLAAIGQRLVTPWTSQQFTTGPHRDKQPFTLSHTMVILYF